MTDVNLINAEVLAVGPDEILVVRVPQDTTKEILEGLAEALNMVGLGPRAIVLGIDTQMAVVKKDDIDVQPVSPVVLP